ncbi:MAG: hypothetical protein LBK58_04110 [Prevotellaceae bacterium]|nr:hypothetical protein [Prevotellaceae bacterium]
MNHKTLNIEQDMLTAINRIDIYTASSLVHNGSPVMADGRISDIRTEAEAVAECNTVINDTDLAAIPVYVNLNPESYIHLITSMF